VRDDSRKAESSRQGETKRVARESRRDTSAWPSRTALTLFLRRCSSIGAGSDAVPGGGRRGGGRPTAPSLAGPGAVCGRTTTSSRERGGSESVRRPVVEECGEGRGRVPPPAPPGPRAGGARPVRPGRRRGGGATRRAEPRGRRGRPVLPREDPRRIFDCAPEQEGVEQIHRVRRDGSRTPEDGFGPPGEN